MCRVFVFADPAVFTESLGLVLKADIETEAQMETQLSLMQKVVQRSLQAALGEERCHGATLAQALQVSTLFTYMHSTYNCTTTFCDLL
ncbi:hypothetical protein NFI96_004861 [Prochilodus magdalenae]|nr:hypothetical protein NFI96_004861 [Prochilodus magdalenae]